MGPQSEKKGWRTLGPYFVIFLACFVIVAPQVIEHSMILGSDSIFHFNRFYDAAKQIQNRNLSFFQTNYGYQQSGRVINAIYGPLFAYLNGAVLGMVGTWYRYEVLSALVIYWIAGVGMYQLAKRLGARPTMGTLLAIIYMNIGWLPRWETAQNMNAWGAALAPFLCICAARMIQDRQQPVNRWQLLAIMTVIIQIHMLSSLFFAVTLVPFFIFGLRSAADPKKMWKATIQAALGTIVLTANVWGALLAMEMSNDIAKPAPFKLTNNVLIASFSKGSRDYILVGVLVLLLAQIIYVILHWWQSRVNTIITAVGAVFLWLSSPFFPWGFLQKAFPTLERILQFPDRLTVLAFPLLFAGVAVTSRELVLQHSLRQRHWRKIGMLVMTLLAVWAQLANMMDIYQTSQSYHTDKVIVHQGGVSKHSPHDHLIRISVHSLHPGQLLQLVEKRSPDYLPVTSKNLSKKYVRSYAYENQIIEHVNEFQHTVLPGGKLQLTWHSNRAGEIRLPIVTYRQSRLTVNGKVVKHYRRSSIGAPFIHQRKGYNRVTLQFVQPWWLTLLIIISLLGIVGVLIFGVIKLLLYVQQWYKS
ncbi:cell division protein [Limosilactobacillus caecicola]|uniref:cell division protein n=1 Tax=Limosilactobacillus caecicola TaxID=2941332 RepID=UPI00203C80CF|nr:cell division protein [Limosilactobacillus caecicola]